MSLVFWTTIFVIIGLVDLIGCENYKHEVVTGPAAASYNELVVTSSIDLNELKERIGNLLADRNNDSPALGIQVQQLLMKISDKSKRAPVLKGSNVTDLLKLSTWTMADCSESQFEKRSASCKKFSASDYVIKVRGKNQQKYANDKFVKLSLGEYCWQFVKAMIRQCQLYQMEKAKSILDHDEDIKLAKFVVKVLELDDSRDTDLHDVVHVRDALIAMKQAKEADKYAEVFEIERICVKVVDGLAIACRDKLFKRSTDYRKVWRRHKYCNLVTKFLDAQ